MYLFRDQRPGVRPSDFKISQVGARSVPQLEECKMEHTQPESYVPVFKPGIGYSEEYEKGGLQGV